jgi:SAM-dependent methyltransferase
MDKIKLDLFRLKAKIDLISVQKFFSKSIERWFTSKGEPKDEFFHLRNCPLCGGVESSFLYKIEGFTYHRCLCCDSIYTKPHLRDGVLDSLYSDGTYQFYQDNLVKKGSTLRKGVLEQRKFFQIRQKLNSNKEDLSILDVGCGGGTFLDICKENGCYVEGVDPSPDARSEHKIKINYGDFNQITFNTKFDVVTFWGVLEHLSDPILAVTKACEILNEGGLIAFEVPSANCFLSEYLKKISFVPTRYIESARHNIFFSKTLIERTAKDHNLEVVGIETNGLDIQTILLEEFDEEVTGKILDIQDTLNDLLLGDHYRVFLKKLS